MLETCYFNNNPPYRSTSNYNNYDDYIIQLMNKEKVYNID